MRPVISSEKHIVQQSLDTTASGVVETEILIVTAKAQSVGVSNEVRIGSSVKAIFIEKWLAGTEAAGTKSTYVLIVEKQPANATDPTAGNMAALDSYANKKNILFTSMGVINDSASTGTPVLRQWIKIPKGKQRFGTGDTLKLSVFAQSSAQLRCGVSIFKEYW